jgi:mannosidase alpha-like ER degradation enhancer 2
MFYHAYNGYLEHAYPKDELKPFVSFIFYFKSIPFLRITCEGQDTWGTYSLTLVDSLDMLLILGNTTEFERATELVIGNMDLSRNMNVSVFETNIRIIGG